MQEFPQRFDHHSCQVLNESYLSFSEDTMIMEFHTSYSLLGADSIYRTSGCIFEDTVVSLKDTFRAPQKKGIHRLPSA